MKNKLKIIIPIAIAVIAIIIAAFVIRFDGGDSVDIRSMMSTAQKYLVENNFEQAVMEYEAIINLEPNNVEAYLGIAEAYVGMGDIGKAIEWLEKGYELTGDERLKNMIDKLNDDLGATEETIATETEATTTPPETTTEETTTTAEKINVPELAGLSREEAIEACASAGIKYSISEGESDSVEKDYVISQQIPAGVEVDKRTTLFFKVSTGIKVTTAMTTISATLTTTTPITSTTVPTTTTTVPKIITSEITTTSESIPTSITINEKNYSTDLTELDLSGMSLTNTDIESLVYMSELKKLNLSNVDYTKYDSHNNGSHSWDFSPLNNLTNLQELNLSNNYFGDTQFETLTTLPNLKKLEVSNCSITDIGTIANFTELEYLDLRGTRCNDLAPLSNLIRLTYLDVSGSANYDNYRDLTPLSKLTNLIYLDLSLCNIKDISPLKHLVKLEKLYLYGNNIEDLSALKNLINLSEVYVGNNDYDSYDEVTNLKEALPDCKVIY